jgi:hypothetical protein
MDYVLCEQITKRKTMKIHLLPVMLLCSLLPACEQEVPKAEVQEEICNDLVDNDQNGFTDCEDFVPCGREALCFSANELDADNACLNGADDDGDGAPDCKDTECFALQECACDPASALIVFPTSLPLVIETSLDAQSRDLIRLETNCQAGGAVEDAYLLQFPGIAIERVEIEVEAINGDIVVQVTDFCGANESTFCEAANTLLTFDVQDKTIPLYIGQAAPGQLGAYRLSIREIQ